MVGVVRVVGDKPSTSLTMRTNEARNGEDKPNIAISQRVLELCGLEVVFMISKKREEAQDPKEQIPPIVGLKTTKH